MQFKDYLRALLVIMVHIESGSSQKIAGNTDCTYLQNLLVGETYYLYNDNYPESYKANEYCSWEATNPNNSVILLNCSDVSIPLTENCAGDHLSVSTTLSGIDRYDYCAPFGVMSFESYLKLEFISTLNTRGGKFLCSIRTMDVFEKLDPKSDCGWRDEERIVGGLETEVNEFPFMAGLVDINRRSVFSAGAIISNKHILTAAHSLFKRNPKTVLVLVGDHDLSTGLETNSAKVYKVERFILHEEYDPVQVHNDIAIIKIVGTIEFSLQVGPICLPFKYATKDFIEETVTILGWGTTEFSGPKSDVLMKAEVKVMTNDRCQMDYKEKSIIRTQICTYEDDKDSCQSDSGGPLVWWDKSSNRYFCIGIISYGMGCGSDLASVNTRVSQYLDWIENKIEGSQLCKKM